MEREASLVRVRDLRVLERAVVGLVGEVVLFLLLLAKALLLEAPRPLPAPPLLWPAGRNIAKDVRD